MVSRARCAGAGRGAADVVLAAWFELTGKSRYAGEIFLEMTFYSNVRCSRSTAATVGELSTVCSCRPILLPRQ